MKLFTSCHCLKFMSLPGCWSLASFRLSWEQLSPLTTLLLMLLLLLLCLWDQKWLVWKKEDRFFLPQNVVKSLLYMPCSKVAVIVFLPVHLLLKFLNFFWHFISTFHCLHSWSHVFSFQKYFTLKSLYYYIWVRAFKDISLL